MTDLETAVLDRRKLGIAPSAQTGDVAHGRVLDNSTTGTVIRLGAVGEPFVGARVRGGERFDAVMARLGDGIAIPFIAPVTSKTSDGRVRR